MSNTRMCYCLSDLMFGAIVMSSQYAQLKRFHEYEHTVEGVCTILSQVSPQLDALLKIHSYTLSAYRVSAWISVHCSAPSPVDLTDTVNPQPALRHQLQASVSES